MEKNKLEKPILSVDVVVFSVREASLSVLTCIRDKEPFKNAPALPGVAVRIDETLSDAARRALSEKAGLVADDIYLDQLATFDALYRDPRGRTVSVAYMGLMRPAGTACGESLWKPVAEISKGSLPFDHDFVIKTATQRLQGKLRYTNIAKVLLQQSFRIEEMQRVYEAILGHSVNRTNFRSKLLKIGMIEKVRELSDAVGKQGGRPPHLYKFSRENVEAVDRDFV